MSAFTGALGGAAMGAGAGAWAGPPGAIVGGVLGGILGLFGGGAQDDAIEAQKAASLEHERRTQAQRDQLLGRSQALAGASGLDVTLDSSLSTYLRDMKLEFQRQHDWNIDQANRGADISKDAAIWGDLSNVGKGIFGIAQANNFFRESPAATTTPAYTPGLGMPLWR